MFLDSKKFGTPALLTKLPLKKIKEIGFRRCEIFRFDLVPGKSKANYLKGCKGHYLSYSKLYSIWKMLGYSNTEYDYDTFLKCVSYSCRFYKAKLRKKVLIGSNNF